MKPMNFPARKLMRQLNAMRVPYTHSEVRALAKARNIRTKKNRANPR